LGNQDQCHPDKIIPRKEFTVFYPTKVVVSQELSRPKQCWLRKVVVHGVFLREL